MKDSSILAGNADNNFLIEGLLLSTKRQSMKESNMLADNATNYLLER